MRGVVSALPGEPAWSTRQLSERERTETPPHIEAACRGQARWGSKRGVGILRLSGRRMRAQTDDADEMVGDQPRATHRAPGRDRLPDATAVVETPDGVAGVRLQAECDCDDGVGAGPGGDVQSCEEAVHAEPRGLAPSYCCTISTATGPLARSVERPTTCRSVRQVVRRKSNRYRGWWRVPLSAKSPPWSR